MRVTVADDTLDEIDPAVARVELSLNAGRRALHQNSARVAQQRPRAAKKQCVWGGGGVGNRMS